MSMINELNGELAVAIIQRLEKNADADRQAMLQMLRQIQTTLRPLSKADRRMKIFETAAARITEERGAAGGH